MKTRNTKYKIRKFGIWNLELLIICFGFLISSFGFPSNVMAQKTSLSVSPPLLELLIKPGKEVKQTYTIANDGNDTILHPQIFYFTPADEAGNIDLTEDESPNWVKYNKDPLIIKGGSKIDFSVLFDPPENINDSEHLLTLIFTTSLPDETINQNSVSYQSQIGTNILVTISKDGNLEKTAEIVEFTAPKIIDSLFGEIKYKVVLKNNGNFLWKPIGKITQNDEILKIAPQNIVSGSTRQVKCVENENLIDCKLKGNFLVGKIVSTLEFTADENSEIYKSEATTLAIPFSPIGLILLLLTITKTGLILNLWRRIKLFFWR